MKNAFKSNINVDAKINQEFFQNIIFCFKGLLFWICFPLSRDGCLPSPMRGKSVDRRVTDKGHSKQLGLPAPKVKSLHIPEEHRLLEWTFTSETAGPGGDTTPLPSLGTSQVAREVWNWLTKTRSSVLFCLRASELLLSSPRTPGLPSSRNH